jgi:NUMOD3 motif
LIKQAVKKYGKENFVRETLFVYDNSDEAFDKEKEIITPESLARKDTYNLKVGGHGGRAKGFKHTEETKQKQSAAQKGKKHTEEHKANIGNAQKGKKHKVITCPHCNTSGGACVMKHFHFDNCKHKGRDFLLISGWTDHSYIS